MSASPTVDLLSLTSRERMVWDAAHLYGYLAGHEAGTRWADERAASFHREAVRVVRALAELPEVDPKETLRRALDRERRWTA